MDDTGGWCTIESDPGVFTELIEGFGVRGLEFQELLSLDSEYLQQLGNIHGLIFLFKYRSGLHKREALPVTPDDLFYAKQVINNACATQSILSILLNLDQDKIELGTTLSEFKMFTEGLDDESRGYAIGSSEALKAVHNSFKPNVSLEISHDEDKQQGDAFHFVSYIWHKGTVYELDGLQTGPIFVGACESRDQWLSIAAPYIQSRIAEYTTPGENEIRFNLMAVVDDPRPILKSHVDTLRTANPSDPLISELEAKISEHESRRSRWIIENKRRRHDFIPLALACLEILASKGSLVQAFQKAHAKAHGDHLAKKEKKTNQ
jgi:ubiquitin carboxyl-terminal hydrolase L5